MSKKSSSIVVRWSKGRRFGGGVMLAVAAVPTVSRARLFLHAECCQLVSASLHHTIMWHILWHAHLGGLRHQQGHTTATLYGGVRPLGDRSPSSTSHGRQSLHQDSWFILPPSLPAWLKIDICCFLLLGLHVFFCLLRETIQAYDG